MPNNWKTYKLGEVAQIKYGKDHKKLDEGTIPCIGTGGVMRYVDSFLSEEESVLIPRKGSLNNIYYINKPFWTVDTLFWTKINTKLLSPRFFYYNLKTIDFASKDVGSAVPSLTTSLLNDLEITIPPLQEQQAIANILSALDDKIELNLETNKTLEEMAMTLYKHWFVDFGPFQNGEFVDSELGKIPKGWEASYMGDVVDLKQGLAINKKTKHLLCEKSESAIPLFKIRDLLNDTIEHYVKRDEVPKQCIATGSDLIFTRTGQVGYVFRWKVGCVHNNCFKVIPNNKLEKEYLYQFLINPIIRQLANDIASGSVQKDLNHTSFKSIRIVLPPMDLQIKFKDVIFPIVSKQNQNFKENQTLTTLRDTLLPKLISGEVGVKEAEKILTGML